jgi:hypothetical protein
MESWWSLHTHHRVNLDFIRSPSGVYQESIHFIRSPSGCVGECNLQTKWAKSSFLKRDCFNNNPISLHLNRMEAWFSDSDQVYIFRTCWRDSNKILIVQTKFFFHHVSELKSKSWNFHLQDSTRSSQYFLTPLDKLTIDNCIIKHPTWGQNNLGKAILLTSFWGSTGAKTPNWADTLSG